jgi:hypothetical protein
MKTREEKAAYLRQYARENAAHIRIMTHQRYLANKKEINARGAEYRKKNKDHINARRRERRAERRAELE